MNSDVVHRIPRRYEITSYSKFQSSPEWSEHPLTSAMGGAGVTRNLVIQFQNDGIDESPRLQEMLQANSAAAPQLAYRVLPGDHTRPLLQTVCPDPSRPAPCPPLPSELASPTAKPMQHCRLCSRQTSLAARCACVSI